MKRAIGQLRFEVQDQGARTGPPREDADGIPRRASTPEARLWRWLLTRPRLHPLLMILAPLLPAKEECRKPEMILSLYCSPSYTFYIAVFPFALNLWRIWISRCRRRRGKRCKCGGKVAYCSTVGRVLQYHRQRDLWPTLPFRRSKLRP